MESVAAALPDALAPLLARYGANGAHVAALVIAWDAIAGPELAARTRPRRLALPKSGGILTLETDPGFAPEVQHREPEIVARINAHMGYECVARLRILQVSAESAKSPQRL
ncbi:MAG: DciA family protein [Alphaproteobacteria bacterium]|nr:DciA family protein [Alphaproteobacteria bacterium]MDA8009123.1 DciA family protein [Alphaproteobacteria bacterium]MDA8032312.1 DciA family protein [Alphaproteobacteria bacterium]